MNFVKYMLVAAACTVAAEAQAAPTIDGSYDAEYGAPTATVAYSRTAEQSNFSDPSAFARAGYNIYLTSDANYVYGLIQGTVTPDGIAGQFANLYFDLDPSAANGSDIGFEISPGSVRAFSPGYSGYAAVSEASAAAAGQNIEFRIANSAFTAPIPGLFYEAGQTFPGTGDQIVLRLSQSLGYSVAGGPTYGPTRLGVVTIQAASSVPEPASWAVMIAGVGAIGVVVRRRRVAVSLA